MASSAQCECVRWIREVKGVNIHGDAYTIKPNISLDAVKEGDVVLFDIGKADHAAYVLEAMVERIEGVEHPVALLIQEANYQRCKVTTRLIAIDNPTIKGIYRAQV